MSAVAEVPRTPRSMPLTLADAPAGFALIEPKGLLAAFNPVFQKLLGIEESDEPTLVVSLIHPHDRALAARLISELFAGDRDSFQLDSETGVGESRLLRWTAWRTRDETGTDDCAAILAEELPSVTAAEQRLRQAGRLEAMGRLAGGVAHDFNNLLTGLLLYCDLLIAGLEPSHRAKKYADEIRKAGLQATGLVRQLLSIARPRNSDPRPISLNEIAEGMRNLLDRLIGENIELNLHLDPNLGLTKMDPTHAQQILLNLVLNARDAMPRGGQITIETGNCKVQVLAPRGIGPGRNAYLPCALFAVEDNGLGMDESVRSHLFEPFFTTKAGKGTGLGLATVHDIVTTNGGLIHVDSRPSFGTRISVLLPLVPESSSSFCDGERLPSQGNSQTHSSLNEE